MIEGWISLMVRFRRTVIVLLVLATLISIFGMRNLRFYNKTTDWLPRDDPQLSLFIHTTEVFSINQLVMVLIRPQNGVFEAEFLQNLQTFTSMMKEQEGVFGVTSLANASDIRRIPGGIEVGDLLERIPASPTEMETFRSRVLRNDFFSGKVVSPDGRWAGVSILLVDQSDITRTVRDVIIPLTMRSFPAEEFHFTGMAADIHFVNQYTQKDLVFFIPVMTILILLILYWNFRSWKGVWAPILVVAVSNIWLFGLMGWLKRPLTIISPAQPVLLIALGSAYGIYVINKVIHEWSHAPDIDRKGLVVRAAAAVAVPILLAAVTDILGFFSLRGVKLSLISDFGMFSAIGLSFAMILALSLIPALAGFQNYEKFRKEKGNHLLPVILRKISSILTQHPLRVVLAFSVIMAALLIFIPRLKMEVGFASFYTPGSEPRRSLGIADRNFQGAYPVSFFFADESVRSPECLRLMRRFEDYFYSKPRFGIPFSIVDLIMELNGNLNNRHALPSESRAVENLWFFMEGREEIRQLMKEDQTEAVVFSRLSETSTEANRLLCKDLDDFLLREKGPRFHLYDLSQRTDQESLQLRRLEAGYLASELAWIAGRDLQTVPAVEEIENKLLQGLDSMPGKSDISAEILGRWREYIGSLRFPFELDRPARERLEEALFRLFFAPGEEAFLEELRRLVPPADFDEYTARDALAALNFMAWEAVEDARVASFKKILAAEWSAPLSPATLKRMDAVLYDLVDGLAMLPESYSTNMKPDRTWTPGRVDQTGYPVMLTKLGNLLLQSQIESLLLAYAVTLLFLILMRRNFLLGFLSSVTILFSTAVMYGLLSLFGLPLDYATMMIGAVSIGVGVDYTIHFLYVITASLKHGETMETAIHQAMQERGRAILSNSLAVIAGFAVLTFSSMIPLRNFGALMVLSMAVSSAAALTLLPAVMMVSAPLFLRKLFPRRSK